MGLHYESDLPGALSPPHRALPSVRPLHPGQTVVMPMPLNSPAAMRFCHSAGPVS